MSPRSEHQGISPSNRHIVRVDQPHYSEACWAQRWPGSDMACNQDADGQLGLCRRHLAGLKERAALADRKDA